MQSFNGEGYWLCLEGNDDDLIATVRAENLAQALESFLVLVAQPISDPRKGSNKKSSASRSKGLGPDGLLESDEQESEGLESEGLRCMKGISEEL